MEAKILSQKLNPLFKREEIELVIFTDKTPSEKEVEEIVSEKFSKNKENVKIKNIIGRFGENNFLIKVDIYEDPESKEEFGMIKKRNKKKKGTSGSK